jgi:hypothetical protein
MGHIVTAAFFATVLGVSTCLITVYLVKAMLFIEENGNATQKRIRSENDL